ncbi:hypothetical protein CLV63_109103 [Murinocardiopsis flavida]|uniref:Uncharacterized protein n=1 Tax=Murinocardiopsis flavida TaxID=645275 RepID=A0A2P8DIP9_9ACTN|nr:hypothetical protein [Murinocardiopsis flavida]PSK97100.1 hypothetical protein CLV63_109103 [Murinocardiopsis flavida]
MIAPRDHGLSPLQFPADIRGRLVEVDRLREVWAARRRRRTDDERAEDQRRGFRRHIVELRAAAGLGAVPAPAARRAVWSLADLGPGDSALRERLRAEEDALAAMAADCRAGQVLDAAYLTRLAASIPDFGAAGPRGVGDLAADTAVETHPLIRAAHLHVKCAEVLAAAGPPADVSDGSGDSGGAGGVPARLRPLPWALGSLALIRSDYAPLIMDHRLAHRHAAALHLGDARLRLGAVVRLFTDLQTAALRADVSASAAAHKPVQGGSTALAGAVHRAIGDRLRRAADSTALVLRTLDGSARASVRAGTADDGDTRERSDDAAERALFHRGPGCWWASLELAVSDAALRVLVAVQDVGSAVTGVLAVTADARLTTREGVGDALDLASTECVTLVPTDSAGERWPAIEVFVDDVLARAIERLTKAMA